MVAVESPGDERHDPRASFGLSLVMQLEREPSRVVSCLLEHFLFLLFGRDARTFSWRIDRTGWGERKVVIRCL